MITTSIYLFATQDYRPRIESYSFNSGPTHSSEDGVCNHMTDENRKNFKPLSKVTLSDILETAKKKTFVMPDFTEGFVAKLMDQFRWQTHLVPSAEELLYEAKKTASFRFQEKSVEEQKPMVMKIIKCSGAPHVEDLLDLEKVKKEPVAVPLDIVSLLYAYKNNRTFFRRLTSFDATLPGKDRIAEFRIVARPVSFKPKINLVTKLHVLPRQHTLYHAVLTHES